MTVIISTVTVRSANRKVSTLRSTPGDKKKTLWRPSEDAKKIFARVFFSSLLFPHTVSIGHRFGLVRSSRAPFYSLKIGTIRTPREDAFETLS